MSSVASAVVDRYRCPGCTAGLEIEPPGLVCRGCGRRYPVRNGIPVFAERSKYWGNVDREAMIAMTRAAEAGDWRDAIRRCLPERVWSHVEEAGRADGVFFLPMARELSVLDAGCMWGGLTVPLARRYARVAALDATFESLDFLRVRTAQEGVTNVELACGSLLSLPYPDASFDVVFVNGVLEWVGLTEDFVVERDYGRRRSLGGRERSAPDALQARALREAHRVLKPGGALFLAIENRYAYKYFLGAPDDHSGVRFTSFMPRAVADLYMRLRLRQQYRTYTYSAAGLRRLLAKAGFATTTLYACCDTYRDPQAVIPLDEPRIVAFYFRDLRLANVPRWKRWLFGGALACGLGPWLVPSFIAVARRAKGGER